MALYALGRLKPLGSDPVRSQLRTRHKYCICRFVAGFCKVLLVVGGEPKMNQSLSGSCT